MHKLPFPDLMKEVWGCVWPELLHQENVKHLCTDHRKGTLLLFCSQNLSEAACAIDCITALYHVCSLFQIFLPCNCMMADADCCASLLTLVNQFSLSTAFPEMNEIRTLISR